MSLLFAVWTGLEPATPCVTGTYSNQLNYQTVFNSFFLLIITERKPNSCQPKAGPPIAETTRPKF